MSHFDFFCTDNRKFWVWKWNHKINMALLWLGLLNYCLFWVLSVPNGTFTSRCPWRLTTRKNRYQEVSKFSQFSETRREDLKIFSVGRKNVISAWQENNFKRAGLVNFYRNHQICHPQKSPNQQIYQILNKTLNFNNKIHSMLFSGSCYSIEVIYYAKKGWQSNQNRWTSAYAT